MIRFLQDFWYRPRLPWYGYFLLPCSAIFRIVIAIRKKCYKLKKVLKSPVVVVGNLTVGGTGKTPCVAYIAAQLKRRGLKPGIVTRGYAGKADCYPLRVNADSRASVVGDEALMLYQQTGLPVVVDPDRPRGVEMLLSQDACNLVISDDGLQHYAMGRVIEIAVVDGDRRFGNGCCLPAGPLREPCKRLKEVDFVITNGDALFGEIPLSLQAGKIRQLMSGCEVQPDFFVNKVVYAVAGIGYPKRFFKTLSEVGVDFEAQEFRDHYCYTPSTFSFLGESEIVIMTEKDAVKCRSFADHRFYYLPVSAVLPSVFIDSLIDQLALSNIKPEYSASVPD